MPTYKLFYFNFTGLGESLRFLLHQSGISFEDKRMTTEEWAQLKPTMPMCQVPVLEIDGKKFYQSKAIGRYIAKKNNLYGSNDLEEYEIDATIDTIDDLANAYAHYQWEKDPAAKAKLKETLDTKNKLFLQKFDEQVKKNGGYFVGGKLSWPDLSFVAQADMFNVILETDVTADYPALKKLVETVKSLPKVKAYLDKRPKTDF